MNIKFQPVKWMAWLLAVLTALAGTNEAFDLLPDRAQTYVLAAISILTLILGYAAAGVVTPLAKPRANDGTVLVPAPTRAIEQEALKKEAEGNPPAMQQ